MLSGHDEFTQIAGEFNDLVDRLQETESARRQFVSDASHELRTPLAAIRLLTDSILHADGEQVHPLLLGHGPQHPPRPLHDRLHLHPDRRVRQTAVQPSLEEEVCP